MNPKLIATRIKATGAILGTGLLLSSAFLACSTMEVQTAADPQTDLARIKTYAWASGADDPAKGHPPNILNQTVKSSVERELSVKGMTPAPAGATPDVLVTYYGASRDVLHYGSEPEYGYPSYSFYGTSYVTREGSLTLQLIHPDSKRIVWQGTATEAISKAGASPEDVTDAVHEIFEKYPKA